MQVCKSTRGARASARVQWYAKGASQLVKLSLPNIAIVAGLLELAQ